ncbi:hypothetical protein [Intestinirhabdus alba]|uniref:Uncharacterized protein n=1 Tax=Intestinirhabdus alba TaxID=2899544 RepID=A0A6L6IP44_9ENTR|nr:hypothetical protein [Intestinirhabdus alba]MTH47316.1 hypothetical protein [Intestinirhabdus alba]
MIIIIIINFTRFVHDLSHKKFNERRAIYVNFEKCDETKVEKRMVLKIKHSRGATNKEEKYIPFIN